MSYMSLHMACSVQFEEKNYKGLYVDKEVWLQCHIIYGTCSPILNTLFRIVFKKLTKIQTNLETHT
jgi:hypothetical protein